MALKFLNKKGWHTGSLRNIENVWKAEQKHEAEERKLDELRKQIQEERERNEFRLLQEQAGLVPRQERLDFLYESGLAVGKGSSDSGFKALEGPPPAATSAPESSGTKAAVPGALFEEKPQSANDAWRKLHSDPLLLIRQREQEALARIKNNPIQMAMIRNSVETDKKRKLEKREKRETKSHKTHRRRESKGKKYSSKAHSASEDSNEGESGRERRDRSSEHHHSRSDKEKHSKKHSSKARSASEDSSEGESGRERRNRLSEHHRSKSDKEKHSKRVNSDSEDTGDIEEERKKSDHSKSKGHQHRSLKHDKRSSRMSPDLRGRSDEEDRRKAYDHLRSEKHSSRICSYPRHTIDHNEDREKRHRSTYEHRNPKNDLDDKPKETIVHDQRRGYGYNRHAWCAKALRRRKSSRLREMQLDAELNEEQRWKRLKKEAEVDAQEALQSSQSGGKNFLDAAQKSIFGTEKGGSSTIEESVRRRAFYSQGSSTASESNAFRRR
ncbi:hypothetical protein J5N97_026365 [Dioscorea zingiberensis]|uniref:CBF1-interacting co-repressor CIR N-terminal domain-containing protein n=1 Tax=Dioscorea zingiberensis TaxID=325984 RepID=A0A9D5C269_9LILI|nr:hypothetical protein J5N97_026365 [Dioscorea zingiberensis]